MPDFSRCKTADGKWLLIDFRPLEEQDESHAHQVTPKQRELHLSTARFRAAIGGRGSGKSQFLLWEAVWYCIQHPGCHVLLLRRDFRELAKGLIQDLQTDVPSELYKYNAQDHVATFTGGSKLFFGHCENIRVEDLNQYLSSSFSFIGVEEAGEFPFAIWDFLIGSNRNKVAGPRPTMALATNPYGIGWGWIKQLFIERKPVAELDKSGSYNPDDYFYNHSTLLDNPYLTAKDPDYINRLNLLSSELRQKMLYGDLDAVSGQYYSNFSVARHVVNLRSDPQRIKWESWQPRWIGSDWGLGHNWVTYWASLAQVRRPNGQYKLTAVIYRELTATDSSIRDYAKLIATHTGDEAIRYVFYSPERFNRTEPLNTPAQQFGEELRKYGLPFPSRASNARQAGATFLYSLLDADELVITDNCPNLIRALPSLVRSEKDLQDVEKANTLEDDCYDACRYAIVSMLHEREKPEEIRHAEKMQTIPDLQSKFLYNFEYQERRKAQSGPIRPTIAPAWQIGR